MLGWCVNKMYWVGVLSKCTLQFALYMVCLISCPVFLGRIIEMTFTWFMDLRPGPGNRRLV